MSLFWTCLDNTCFLTHHFSDQTMGFLGRHCVDFLLIMEVRCYAVLFASTQALNRHKWYFFSWFSVLDQIASNSCKILALAIRQVEMKKSADYEQSNVGRAFPRLSVLICTLWVVIGINSWVSFS